jgi:hypothetical protein
MRLFYFQKNLKNNHYSVLQSNRRTIASYDITLKYREQQSGNFSSDSLNQDSNTRPVDWKANTTRSEPYIARNCLYAHKCHRQFLLRYLLRIRE